MLKLLRLLAGKPKTRKPTVAPSAIRTRPVTTLPRGAFAEDRHRPEGVWTQFSVVEEVAGVQRYRANVEAFAARAAIDSRAGRPYGLTLQPDPSNAHDPKAIKVLSAYDGAQLGFLPRGLAAEVTDELVAHGHQVAVELYRIYHSDGGFIEVKVIVLGPKGFSHSARMRKARNAE